MDKMRYSWCVVALAISGCASAVDGEDSPIGEIASAATNCPLPPGPLQAVFFFGDQAMGSCVTLNQGSYGTSVEIGLPDNSIRSVRLGSLTRASLFADASYGGSKTLLLQNTNGLTPNTSSLRVESIFDNCESSSYRPGAGAVALYKDINFHGDCVVVRNQEQDPFTNCSVGVLCPPGRFPGVYTYPGIPNDSISSVYIGPSTSVTFCRDIFFRGTCELMQNPNAFAQAQPNFGNTLIGNDTVSSMIVTLP